jgi:hypothetical protein
LNIRRDKSFNLDIANKTAGVNVYSTASSIDKEFSIVKPLISKLNEDSEDLWKLSIIKHSVSSNNSIAYEVFLESNPLKIIYEADAIHSVSSFFKLDSIEEIRARALNKLASIKASTQMSLSDLFYKRQNKILFKIASPVLIIPFKA